MTGESLFNIFSLPRRCLFGMGCKAFHVKMSK